MKYRYRTKIVGLSVVVAALLGSNAYAGKIITNADVNNIVVTPDKQFGFGGWNFDNVAVRIVNIADFSTPTLGTFDTLSGEYTGMGTDMSFESDISTGGEIRGHLHGKDWPVGEPAGIKIINDDTKVQHGKPVNCIMTSSYQEFQIPDDNTSGSGYLDAFAEGNMPNPVLCSSGWQTHKRYKINLLPSTVAVLDAEGYGQPVDLVFKLDLADANTTVRRYQVLQKANNYTGMRLDGYKVEVLDADGFKNDALTLSLGEGEGDAGGDIWAISEMANFSHGLWGPFQEVNNVVRFENGFFDWIRAYYPAALSTDKQTISYIGDMMGGNYQNIFGNWLPSIWAPMGIFHDDDMNPATDGILRTYYGVAPGETALAWWTRSVVDIDPNDNIDPVYTWAQATAEELELWQGEWYEEDHVEDVLNLGLNYIIEVGENAEIGSTFTLRLTPHVAADQSVPVYIPVDPTDNDFNRDGSADILWKNTVGDHTVSLMDERGEIGTIFVGQADWNVTSIDDFNGDGNADILWKRDDGVHYIWLMSKTGKIGTIYVGQTQWNVESTGDFNGDGKADILWKRDNGLHEIWLMDETGKIGTMKVGQSTWLVKEVNDFNGDGKADILWKRDNGVHYIWLMNETGKIGTIYVGQTKWSVQDAGDFNGDGKADILWKRDNDVHYIWLMDETGKIGTIYVGQTTWSVQGVDDFNGDRKADILWKRDDSDHDIWLMDATGRTETISVGNSTWSVQPQ